MGSSLGGTSMGSSLGWINERMKRKNELEFIHPQSPIALASQVNGFKQRTTEAKDSHESELYNAYPKLNVAPSQHIQS
jgi:hypothetical protein